MNLFFRIAAVTAALIIVALYGNWCCFWGVLTGSAIYSLVKFIIFINSGSYKESENLQPGDGWGFGSLFGVLGFGVFSIYFCNKAGGGSVFVWMAAWIVSTIILHFLWDAVSNITPKLFNYLYVLYIK